MKLSLALLIFLILTACSSVDVPAVQASVDEQYLQGTWLVLNNPSEKEVFLGSKEYCAYQNSKSPSVVGIGSWRITQPGYVFLSITDSIYPNQITSGDIGEFRIVKRMGLNKLLMGYSCDHCEGGIAGQIYIRAKTQIDVCGKSIGP